MGQWPKIIVNLTPELRLIWLLNEYKPGWCCACSQRTRACSGCVPLSVSLAKLSAKCNLCKCAICWSKPPSWWSASSWWRCWRGWGGWHWHPSCPWWSPSPWCPTGPCTSADGFGLSLFIRRMSILLDGCIFLFCRIYQLLVLKDAFHLDCCGNDHLAVPHQMVEVDLCRVDRLQKKRMTIICSAAPPFDRREPFCLSCQSPAMEGRFPNPTSPGCCCISYMTVSN